LFDELRDDSRRWILARKFDGLDLCVRVVLSLLLEPVVQQLALLTPQTPAPARRRWR
jgi:hypothetical protein